MAIENNVRKATHLGGTRGLIRVGQLLTVQKVTQGGNDHKKLFSLINDLHDAMISGKRARDPEGCPPASRLHQISFHFAAEEALLEKTGYPALGPHRVQHKEFVRKVEHFENEVKSKAIGPICCGVHFSERLAAQSHSKDRPAILLVPERPGCVLASSDVSRLKRAWLLASRIRT